jgi:cellulose synthase/poly-beta-1,6-N-acetylglucosamine synthase-like glycosyltransferase
MSEDLFSKPAADASVAISTRGRPEVLGRCLAALLEGSTLPAEIIVVDQSQDDRSKQVVEACQSGPVVLKYHRHLGQGLGVSQNIAFRLAASRVVAVTDDDCVPAPDWMEVIARVFSSEDGLDALTGRVLPLGPEQPGAYPVASRASLQRVDFTARDMPWETGSGNNFAVRRSWLEKIGGNDERLGPGAPGQGAVDIDLFYRLLLAGARLRYEPEMLVFHEQTDLAGRMGRRWPYGFGMGACCSFHLRAGNRGAWRILLRWLKLRLERLFGGLARGDWLRVKEEALVIGGTVRGLLHGAVAGPRVSPADEQLKTGRGME